jgi:ketosteroid isomerase-like protein
VTLETNKALVQRYFSVVTGADTSTDLGSFFASNVIWRVPQTNPAIKPNPRVGHAAVMDLLTSGVNIYQAGSLEIQQQRVVADESCVMVQFALVAKLANGTDYKNDYVMLFSISENKIDGVWEYLDTLYQSELGTFDNLA